MTFTDDYAAVTAANLAEYDVFVMLHLAPFDLSAEAQAALQAFIEQGGGWVGVHAAGLTGRQFVGAGAPYWEWFETFLGGTHAQALEDEGEAAAAAFAIEELRHLLGADFARGLTPIMATRWAHEPTIGGSYSHALPGRADARKLLRTPVSERLCFTGEACSPVDFSTAHGAWESGLAAADWIERGLRREKA